MMLTAVHYELFESDAWWLDQHPESERHVLDREIRLTFADRAPLFVSWSDAPIQYAIGYQDRSFFVNEPEVVRDMTNSAMWAGVIGREITMKFDDDDHQVLRIAAPGSAVFCCSHETDWEADVVTVTNHAPNRLSSPPSRTPRRG